MSEKKSSKPLCGKASPADANKKIVADFMAPASATKTRMCLSHPLFLLQSDSFGKDRHYATGTCPTDYFDIVAKLTFVLFVFCQNFALYYFGII